MALRHSEALGGKIPKQSHNKTYETETARGHPYHGAPLNGSTVETGEPVQTRVLWHRYESDKVVRCTDLNQATGMTTAQALSNDYIACQTDLTLGGFRT